MFPIIKTQILRSQIFVFVICIVLGVVLHSSQAEDNDNCPPFEREVDCIDFCNTCESDSLLCKTVCTPGCDCIPGYTRDDLGICIPEELCDVSELQEIASTCPDVEKCKKKCIKRGFKTGKCTGPRKCTCTNDDSEAEIEIQDHGCPIVSQCSDYCKSQGFESGRCLGLNQVHCYCVRSQDRTCPDVEKCKQSCIERGFQTGKCIQLTCQCSYERNIQTIIEDWTTCTDDSCRIHCSKLGYKDSVCDSARNTCTCRNWW